MEHSRVQMAELVGPWRFHAGDNPAWANPGFDDSHWSLLTTDKPWTMQGYKGYAGYAWYRLDVALPAHHQPLALYLPGVNDSCQIFANGHLLRQVGDLPPEKKYIQEPQVVVPIPDSVLVPGQPLLLAVRVWHWPLFATRYGGGIFAPRLGALSAISEWRTLQERDTFWENAGSMVELYGNLLTALAGLCLFALRRKEREYLWFGLSQLLWGAFGARNISSSFLPTGYFDFFFVFLSLFALATFFQVEFLMSFTGLRRRLLYWAIIASILLSTLANLHSVFTGERTFGLLFSFASLFTAGGEIGLLWLGTKKGNADAPLLILAYSVMFCIGAMGLLAAILFFDGSAWAPVIQQHLNEAIHWPFILNAEQLGGAFEMFAVLFVLVRRYARSRKDEERMEAELEAARVVQKVLIPEEIPSIPGFRVETVYKPAGQVGGDFFQVIPTVTGGALIAIGDVSGKGLPAAMTVSLLVGTFRTLAHYTRSPGEILRAMNQRMLARSDGGFTTCLVLRLDPDGSLTIANAGHIAPYVGRHEVQVINGLPLGLSAETTYAETTAQLGKEGHLTLITDGVVEARSHSGELFGFERTTAISDEPAEQIALAAQAFGQEDDITVLSLTRQRPGSERDSILASPSLSSAPA